MFVITLIVVGLLLHQHCPDKRRGASLLSLRPFGKTVTRRCRPRLHFHLGNHHQTAASFLSPIAHPLTFRALLIGFSTPLPA